MQKLLKILSNLVLLAIFIAGLYNPLVWILLLIILYASKDSETRKHNQSQTTVEQPIQPDKINLNHYRQWKQQYLKSPEWKALKSKVLNRDNYTCQSCNTNGISLEVHHITYQNFGNENLSDLVSLCRNCHQSIHDKHGYDYNKLYPLG